MEQQEIQDEWIMVCRLSEFRKRHGHKLKDVSRLTGITEANLSKLDNDKAQAVRFETIIKLCRLYKCNIGDMFTIVRPNKAENTLASE